ncbi:MAG TPA: hypothetical protein VFO84_07395 [Dehalococcoidia bacterium]|nr:hypothetical protein [Dehalococcoidia bacterium]
MPEGVLFVPSWAMSPRTVEELPAVRQALDDFRAHYEVDVFTHPWVKGDRDSDCSWSGQIAAIDAQLSEDHHLVVMGTCVAAALLAATKKRPRSFIAAGMVTPPGTLHALGHSELANVFISAWEGGSSYQYTRLVMEGAPEELWDRYAHMMDADIDWPRFLDELDSFRAANLLQHKPDLAAPALYLESPLRVAGYAEQRDAFLKFVPHSEVAELQIWPGQLHEKASGRDLSQKAIAFIQRHSDS